MEKCQCSQCGSTDFLKEGTEFLRCIHCKSLFRMLKPAKPASKVVIGKGANVVFGTSGKVTIGGELIIENGANVSFLGELDVIQKASPDEIERAKQHLKLIKES